MDNELPLELKQTLHLGDGYKSKPIWTQEKNMSTYYDYQTDRQCGVPIKSLRELRQELGLEFDYLS